MSARESIEAALLARQAAVEDAWQTPETDVALLRSELAACRDEIARLRGDLADDRVATALDHAVERLTQWVSDGGTVHTDLLLELLEDIDEVVA